MADREPDEEVASPVLNTRVAHIARVYNYWLGGKDNFAVDRRAGDILIKVQPVVEGVRGNRAFLARAVRYLAGECGIRQFLDIGTGLPASDNTHEVAQAVAPESRVVYVDNDHCKSGCAQNPDQARLPESRTGATRGLPASDRRTLVRL